MFKKLLFGVVLSSCSMEVVIATEAAPARSSFVDANGLELVVGESQLDKSLIIIELHGICVEKAQISFAQHQKNLLFPLTVLYRQLLEIDEVLTQESKSRTREQIAQEHDFFIYYASLFVSKPFDFKEAAAFIGKDSTDSYSDRWVWVHTKVNQILSLK